MRRRSVGRCYPCRVLLEGRYRYARELGRGGSGRVVLAHDVRDEAIRIAIQENSALAARHEREHGKMKTTDDAQKLAGEENQDDGGEDPA